MTTKLLVITVQIPWGRAEGFILEELLEMKTQGAELLIIPRDPPKEVFHENGEKFSKDTIWLPLINFRMLMVFFRKLLSNISMWKILGTVLFNSRNISILTKNSVVLPKSIFIGEMVRRKKVEHIHAHWGTTTATMGYIVSRMTGIPWSFTLHRWDIKEDNILREKIRSAKFVRCISECGKRELLEMIGHEYREKIVVIHMGARIPLGMARVTERKRNESKFTILTPANLLEVKGHRYLIDACSILRKEGIRNFQCIFYGEGPLKKDLEKRVKDSLLTENVSIPGVLLSHEELIHKYKNGEIDIVVLPSITTDKGEHEGIPVSAMEAMAHNIPVISTKTGGIPELLYGGAGLMVNEKSPSELANAIRKLMTERGASLRAIKNGYERVEKEFNVRTTTRKLLELISQAQTC
jgi:colanic acid/amylovoran biosynthesis glycosyltransferase